jgi:hypothetical protein
VTYEQRWLRAAPARIDDDHGRLMAAICHNMDPEKFSALGIRIGISYVVNTNTR